MVVLTEYGFDVSTWRAGAGGGPRVIAVHLRTAGHHDAWQRLELASGIALHLQDEGPAGIARVVLASDGPATRDEFRLGDVAFAWR